MVALTLNRFWRRRTEFVVQYPDCNFVYTCPRRAHEQDNEDYFESSLRHYVDVCFSPKRQQRYRRAIRQFEPYKGGGRVLEIGCTVGGFLYAAWECGWDAVGVDPVEACAKYARDSYDLNAIGA